MLWKFLFRLVPPSAKLTVGNGAGLRVAGLRWVHSTNGSSWTPEEDEVVRHLRQDGTQYSDIALSLADRSAAAIALRWQRVGPRDMEGRLVMSGSRGAWSPGDDKLLTELRRAGVKWKDIADRLPGRSYATLRGRWRYLQPTHEGWAKTRANRRWTEQEDMHLLHHREESHLRFKMIARKLNRTTEGVGIRYARLKSREGLSLPGTRQPGAR